MKLLEQWHARGYRMDAVLYKKYPGSTYIDPHDEPKVAFKDLPNRFPSVRSRDFRRESGQYEDFDNLFAMYALYNMGRYSVRVNEATKLLEISVSKHPMPYAEAAERATKSARADSDNFYRHLEFQPSGTAIGEPDDLVAAPPPLASTPVCLPEKCGTGSAEPVPMHPGAVR